MNLIEWNDSLSVKIAEIDSQHQRLIALINDLNEAMKFGKSKEILNEVLTFLINYTDTHFSTEEKYMDKYNYPESITHKSEHKNFVKKVMDFKKGFDEGKLMLSMELMNFLKEWLIKHIKGTDQKYSVFFNSKGLK